MELNFNSVEINPDAQRIGGVQDRQRQGVQGGQILQKSIIFCRLKKNDYFC